MSKIIIEDNSKPIDIEYFKDYGGDAYSNNYKSYTVSAGVMKAILNNVGIQFSTILDAGCASGELVRDLREIGLSAFGIENNKEILKSCSIPEYCVHADIKQLAELPENLFDVVFCNALMYFNPDEIDAILKIFRKITKKAFYLCVPYCKDSFEDPYRKFRADQTWWDDKFVKSGFKKITKNIYI